ELLRQYGAEPVVYGRGLADRVRDLSPSGIDVALDFVGTDEAIDVSLQLVHDRERIATVVAMQRGPETGIKVLGSVPGADPGIDVREKAWGELVELAANGSLETLIAEKFP